jgi:hypothetical protein
MQNTRTRIAVRMRDRRCLITGQPAIERARGGNFTGLEVAHIFPLMGVGIVRTCLPTESIHLTFLTFRQNGQCSCLRLLGHK